MVKKKIGIIVQRYGQQVNGGAEVLARMIAEKLQEQYDVTVLTSRALDYHTWNPELPAGESYEGSIRILRFDHLPKRIISQKKQHKENRRDRGRLPFQKIYRALGQPKWYLTLFPLAAIRDVPEGEWLEKQGPATYDLIPYLKEHEDEYTAYIFVTYLYYPTAVGMPTVAHKSIFIPTMHDETPAYKSVFKKIMAAPKAILFLTESEKRFSEKMFDIGHVMKKVVSVGIDFPDDVKDHAVLSKFGISKEYVLYVGRIDEYKGCKDLIDFFLQFLKEKKAGMQLVLAGKNALEKIEHPNVVYTGFISDEDKVQLMKQAKVLAVPSKYESLSLVLLESFACKVPVIANEKCEVLKDHIEMSSGGWLYTGKNDFIEKLNAVYKGDDNLTKGAAGYEYVLKNYTWKRTMDIFDETIEYVASGK